MNKRLIMSLAISVLCYSFGLSQNNSSSTTRDGLQRINVSTVKGTITVNLPTEIHSNDQISGTVIAVPENTGTSKRDKKRAQKQKKDLEKYTVSFGGNPMPVSDTTIALKVPEVNPDARPELTIYDDKGNAVATVPIPVNNAVRTPNGSNTMQIPNYLRAGNTCYIKGNFDGNTQNSEVVIGDTTLPIIAEAPDRIICEVPTNISGQQTITVTENGITNTASCNVVGMNLSVGKFNLLKGESTNLNIEVFGLNGIETPVEIVVENKTQENIQLQGGDVQNITIYPHEASAQGTYNKTIQIQSKKAGDFVIDVTLIESHENTTENHPVETTEETEGQETEVLTNNIPMSDHLITYNPSTNGANFLPYTLSTGIMPNVFFSYNVLISDDDKRKLRNKGRDLPEDAPLGPTAIGDKKKPYSRPVPNAIKAPVHEEFPGVWKTGKALLKEAKKEVERAKAHKGKIVVGIPGTDEIRELNNRLRIIHEDTGCIDSVYIFYQRLRYIDDRTLVLEEQLSPSYPFFMGEGQNKLNITKTESGLSVTPGVSADVKGLSIGIQGTFWKKTTHTISKGVSNFKGRKLWLFHIGRLYLYRKAFVRIKYEYHYKKCKDGSTENWVVPTYYDYWHYRYEWEEELVVAFKDNEGTFHRLEDFPKTTKSRKVDEGTTFSYELEKLEPKYFENYGAKGWDFFPTISKK